MGAALTPNPARDDRRRLKVSFCRIAVLRFLAIKTGTRRDIALATGFAERTVTNIIRGLRHEGNPFYTSVLDSRGHPQMIPEVIAEKYEPWPKADTSGVLASALENRSELERAWL